MTIESGTTSDRRNRILIYLALFLLFGGWFGYDGYVGYPAKNMLWARQNIGLSDFPDPAQLKANPAATLDNLKQVQTGMTVDEVKQRLGEPTHQSGADWCYVGVASFGHFVVDAGKVKEIKKVLMNSEPSENDVALQRWTLAIMGLCAIGTLIHLARVLSRRTIVDDQGIRIGKKLIAWDAMQSLDAAEYARKGWLNLVYEVNGQSAQVRLDSYDIDFFDEIVTEICRRKGFTSPLPPPEADQPSNA